MKKYLLPLVLAASSLSSCAQTGTLVLPKPGTVLSKLSGAATQTASGSQGIPQTEVAQGLQEALVQGAGAAVGLLGKTTGFSNSPIYRIPLPPEADRLRSKIDANPILKATVGPQLDATVARMNEGAEKAVARALPLFKRAILSMTFADAYGRKRRSAPSRQRKPRLCCKRFLVPCGPVSSNAPFAVWENFVVSSTNPLNS